MQTVPRGNNFNFYLLSSDLSVKVSGCPWPVERRMDSTAAQRKRCVRGGVGEKDLETILHL